MVGSGKAEGKAPARAPPKAPPPADVAAAERAAAVAAVAAANSSAASAAAAASSSASVAAAVVGYTACGNPVHSAKQRGLAGMKSMRSPEAPAAEKPTPKASFQFKPDVQPREDEAKKEDDEEPKTQNTV